MHRFAGPCIVLAIILVLGAPFARPAADRATPLPLISVSPTPKPPTVDGQIGDSEWRFGSRTTGFLNLASGQAAVPQTSVYLTFDSDRLYLAFECALTSERSPDASETNRDGRVWSDDSVEVILLPPGRKETQFYHFIGNSIGAFYDTYARNRRWNGGWQYEADSGMGWWRGELSIPFDDLGIEDPVGQTWRANFARNAGPYTSWADTGRGYINPPRFGYLRFCPDGVVTRIDAVEGLRTGQPRVSGRVVNPGAATAKARLGVRVVRPVKANEGEWPRIGSNAWRPARQFNLASRAHFDFVVSASSPGEELNRLDVSMQDPTGRDLYRQSIPFVPTGIQYVSLLSEPSEETVVVRADLRGLPKGKRIDIEASFENGEGKQRTELSCAALDAGRIHTFEQDVRGWPLGPYQARARLTASDSKEVLHETALSYERIAPPKWFTEGRKIGLARRVLKPWTPIEWDGQTLGIWGRQHRFEERLLPAQIASAGEALLAQPAALRAIVDGRSVEAQLDRRETLESGPDAVVTQAHGQLGPMPVQVNMRAEYDGMLVFDVDLRPRAEARVERLWLSLPIRRDRALYYHEATQYYGRGKSGLVPSDGLRLPFRPFVWLGDNERGLMWFAESPEGWHTDRYPILIQPSPKGTELRVEFVNRARTYGEPMRLVFGLQATPVKPVPPDWRAWRADYQYTRRLAQKHLIDWEAEGIPLQWRFLWWTDGYQRVFTPGHTTPLQVMPDLKRHVEAAHARGTRLVTYFYLHGVNRITTGFDRYYPVWQTSNPREMSYWGRVIMGACPGSTMGDQLLYGIREMVREHGIDGVYFDGAAPPVPCANALHGHGWTDEQGHRRPVYPIFALRRFYKRLATMLSEHVERPIIWIHADGKMPTPVASFTTANWEGEMVQGQLKGGAYLSDLLGLDFWRAHMLATQWGVVPMWLPSRYGTPEQKARQARDTMALLLVHGTPVARVPAFDREILRSVWKAQADFGIDQAQFRGYWENADQIRVSPGHERLAASFYRRGNRYLVVVANFTDEIRRASIELLSARGVRFAHDAISGKPAPFAHGRVEVTTGPRSFRLIVVRVLPSNP